MKFYLAPMEGVTGYIYRNAYHNCFHNIDCYYTPFLAPNKHHGFSSKEKNDILPEHNAGMRVVPQILTNQAEYFIRTARALQQLGYDEVNLNLGCPSPTVVTKKKGAGMLAETDQLEHFLEDIFEGVYRERSMDISIKTRIGIADSGEVEDLIDLYNQFPLKELIIHPRVQKDLYNNKPNWDAFGYAVEQSKHKLCYNGNLFTVEDYHRFCDTFPQIEAVMLGRGILRDPGLVDRILGKAPASQQTLKLFHDEILNNYQEAFSGDKPVLFKMKELWVHMLPLLDPQQDYAKKIRKVEKISDYCNLVAPLFM